MGYRKGKHVYKVNPVSLTIHTRLFLHISFRKMPQIRDSDEQGLWAKSEPLTATERRWTLCVFKVKLCSGV
jgi:hypothetical protein